MVIAITFSVYGKNNKYKLFNSICTMHTRACQLLSVTMICLFCRTQHFMKKWKKNGDVTEAKEECMLCVCMCIPISKRKY